MDARPTLHPTDPTLQAYGLGKLDDLLAETVDNHLEGCPDCRRRIAELTSDSFLGRVRDARKADRSSSSPPADTLPPGLADHPDYEVRRELGRGGMGVVYLAHNRLLGRDEVLKVMGREIMERSGVLDRFLREMRSVARLRHPNIVTAYSAFRVGESIVFAMEYIEGLDLAKLVKAKGPLPVGHACSFAHQAALGLQHAHEEGMVHRDIKPGNLMLSRRGDRGVVKVLDFGLAKATREEEIDGTLTHAGQMLGTPDYIAPEQTLDAKEADIRADIYSLGCSLYYLLTGGPPFRGTNLYDILQAHHSVDAKPLNFIRPEVPVELAEVVDRMMAKEPGRRFQTPDEVARALTPFFKKVDGADARSSLDASQAKQSFARPKSVVDQPKSIPVEAATPPPMVSTPPRAPRPDSVWVSLIEATAAVARVRKPPRVWAASAVGILLLSLLVAWAAGIIRIKTPSGVIVLEGLPADANVFVDGGMVRVGRVGGETAEITVPPGRRGVEVRSDGFLAFGEEVIVDAGGEVTLVVRLEPSARSGTAGGSLPLVGPSGAAWIGFMSGRKVGPEEVAKLDGERVAFDGTLNRAGLRTERSFKDFTLSLEYRFPKDGKLPGQGGGIILMPESGAGLEFAGVECHVGRDDSGTLQAFPGSTLLSSRTGGEFRTIPATAKSVRAQGKWNDLSIRCDGPRITVIVNGLEVNEAESDKPIAARIGLMSKGEEIQFRNLRLASSSDVRPPPWAFGPGGPPFSMPPPWAFGPGGPPFGPPPGNWAGGPSGAITGAVESPDLYLKGTLENNENSRIFANIATFESDPLKGLPLPASLTSMERKPALVLDGIEEMTIFPGVYEGGFQISGICSVRLMPGIYLLKGGGLNLSDACSLRGAGVAILNLPSKSTDAIVVRGSIEISSPTTLSGAIGAFNGISIYQDPKSEVAIKLDGNSKTTLTGTLYAPSASLHIDGNALLRIDRDATNDLPGRAILSDLRLSGNGGMALNPPMPPRSRGSDPAGGSGGSPTRDENGPTQAPVGEPPAVPPSPEEDPAAQPAVSIEALKQLRGKYRQLRVSRLQSVMDGVRRACESDRWRRDDWRDYHLEFALDELIDRVGSATGRTDLVLPVRFGALPAGSAEKNPEGIRMATPPGIEIDRATRCVLLADGDLTLSYATDCLILATGKVTIHHGEGNAILAGDDINDSFSEGNGAFQPSLLISGTRIEMRHCSNLICSAPKGVGGRFVKDAAILNSPVSRLEHQSGCAVYSSQRLDFRLPARTDRGGRDG